MHRAQGMTYISLSLFVCMSPPRQQTAVVLLFESAACERASERGGLRSTATAYVASAAAAAAGKIGRRPIQVWSRTARPTRRRRWHETWYVLLLTTMFSSRMPKHTQITCSLASLRLFVIAWRKSHLLPQHRRAIKHTYVQGSNVSAPESPFFY